MKFCNMAVVVPVDQLTGSKAALSTQVWGQVSNLLMPALGKLYRQFHPANDAWGHKQMCIMLGGISMKTAYKLLGNGEIHHLKIGKSFKIPKICVIEYLLG